MTEWRPDGPPGYSGACGTPTSTAQESRFRTARRGVACTLREACGRAAIPASPDAAQASVLECPARPYGYYRQLRGAVRGERPSTPAETQVQRGHNEQVEQRRSDQATQDDDGQRVLDLVTGKVAGHHQGPDGQC